MGTIQAELQNAGPPPKALRRSKRIASLSERPDVEPVVALTERPVPLQPLPSPIPSIPHSPFRRSKRSKSTLD